MALTQEVLIKFVPYDKRYSKIETIQAPLSIQNSNEPEQLKRMLLQLIKEPNVQEHHPELGHIEAELLDLLINRELLAISIGEHIKQHQITTEQVIEVEWRERVSAPVPADSLQHPDWVSCISSLHPSLLPSPFLSSLSASSASALHILIASGAYDGVVRVWHAGEGSQMVELNGHAKPVKCVAWLPPAAAAAGEDSALHLVSGSIDQSLRVWRVRLERGVRAVGECVSVCRGHTGSVDCVALSPDSRRLCSGSWDRNVKIWSVDELLSGAPSADAAAASESIESEAPPPEKRAREETEKGVTEGAQPAIRAPLVTLAAHSEGVSGIQWTQSNELCTAGMDHAIRFWDLEMARVKASFACPRSVLDVSYSPVNGLLIASFADRHIRLYDPRVGGSGRAAADASDAALETSASQVVQCTFGGHLNWVSAVQWAPVDAPLSQFLFLSGSYDTLAKLWDTRSPRSPLYSLSGHSERLLDVDWSTPQLLATAAADSTLKLFAAPCDYSI